MLQGAGKLLRDSRKHPAQLRSEVCTPGGTTIYGLHTLEQGGVRAAAMSAVESATERARELGLKSGARTAKWPQRLSRCHHVHGLHSHDLLVSASEAPITAGQVWNLARSIKNPGDESTWNPETKSLLSMTVFTPSQGDRLSNVEMYIAKGQRFFFFLVCTYISQDLWTSCSETTKAFGTWPHDGWIFSALPLFFIHHGQGVPSVFLLRLGISLQEKYESRTKNTLNWKQVPYFCS